MSPDTISYFVYEDAMARFERHIKRQWIAIIILLAALILTNAGWIYYEAQFENISVSQDVRSDSGDLVLNGIDSGNIYGNESKTDN